MLEEYRKHVAERAAEGIVPKPLDASQMAALVESLKNPPKGEEEFLLDLLINRVPPGVDGLRDSALGKVQLRSSGWRGGVSVLQKARK